MVDIFFFFEIIFGDKMSKSRGHYDDGYVVDDMHREGTY